MVNFTVPRAGWNWRYTTNKDWWKLYLFFPFIAYFNKKNWLIKDYWEKKNLHDL